MFRQEVRDVTKQNNPLTLLMQEHLLRQPWVEQWAPQPRLRAGQLAQRLLVAGRGQEWSAPAGGPSRAASS